MDGLYMEHWNKPPGIQRVCKRRANVDTLLEKGPSL